MVAKKTAFIFTSSREGTIEKVRKGEDADTSLRGSNYLTNTDCFVIPSKSIKSLIFITRLLRYDFIIAQDNLFLGYFISRIASIFNIKTKWIYIAMNSSTLIKRNSGHFFKLFFLKRFWSSYTRIVCLSYEQMNDFIKIGIKKNRLVFIPFGVDTHFFQSDDSKKVEDLIVSVGRDAGRNYETLLNVAQKLPYKFIIVASRKNIPDVSIPSNVSILYDISLEEIRDLYKRAKLVVVVSKDVLIPDGSDCSGQTVILDALSTHKAVIATYRPWIKDYFVANQDLLVVPPNDSDMLVDAIDSLWKDDLKRNKIALSGYNKTVSRYSTETFSKSLDALMESI